MTDTSARVDRYDLIPGRTAYGVNRISRVVGAVLTVIAVITLTFLRLSSSDDQAITAPQLIGLISAFVVPALLAIPFIVATQRRSRAESAAGYTTMTRGYNKFDQVDPRSGIVIRRAGSAVRTLPSRATGSVTAAAPELNLSSLDGLRFTESAGDRLRRAVPGVGAVVGIIAGVLIVAAGSGSGDTSSDRILGWTVWATIAGIFVLLGATVAGVALYARARLRAAAAHRPDSLVFMTRLTPELLAALKEAGISSTKGRQQLVVTASSHSLELWPRSGSTEPWVTLPWDPSGYVHPGRLLVNNGNSMSASVKTLHVFRTFNEGTLDFPLPVMGRRAMGFASANYANQVLDAMARYAKIA